MLVVTRQEGEEVVIGDPKNPIGVVRIASIRGDRVRIAFDFPRDIQVNRREVADQKKDETGQAQSNAQPQAMVGLANGTNGEMNSPVPPANQPTLEVTVTKPERPELRPTVIGVIRPKLPGK